MVSGATSQLAAVALAMLCAGGLAWALLYPYLSGAARAEKRLKTYRRAEVATTATRQTRAEAMRRRKQVQDTLSEIDAKERARRKRPALKVRIQQAGLGWSVRTFVLVSVALAVVAGLGGLAGGLPLLVVLALAVAAGLGLPHWLLAFLRKRRIAKFLDEFPNAVDVIVRGVKAGLPLNDCMRMVAAEIQEPVRGEFRDVVESQALGLSIADGVMRMYERMPLAEVNFFTIVVAIQQSSGGNLAEALANLARVLRDRKRMKAKIQAMSQEAKASAAIIGSLPIIVMGLVFVTSPDYIALLWTEPLGQMMLAGSGLWMLTGILVMRKMINFDF